MADGTRSICSFGPIRTWAPISRSVSPPSGDPVASRVCRCAARRPAHRLLGMFAGRRRRRGGRPGLAWRPLLALLWPHCGAGLALAATTPLLATLPGWGVTGALPPSHGGSSGIRLLADGRPGPSSHAWRAGARTGDRARRHTSAVAAFGMYATAAGVPTVVGGARHLCFVASAGVAVRYCAAITRTASARDPQPGAAMFWRGFHDTVAHHVSADGQVVQAGGVVGNVSSSGPTSL